jgi:hypothetical protein
MAFCDLGQFDEINQMIVLSVITLRGFHCIEMKNFNSFAAHILSNTGLDAVDDKEVFFWPHIG